MLLSRQRRRGERRLLAQAQGANFRGVGFFLPTVDYGRFWRAIRRAQGRSGHLERPFSLALREPQGPEVSRGTHGLRPSYHYKRRMALSPVEGPDKIRMSSTLVVHASLVFYLAHPPL